MGYEGEAEIRTRKDLKRFLDYEKNLYIPKNRADRWYLYLTNDSQVRIWRYQKKLRASEYWFNNRHRSPLHYLLFLIAYRRKNNAGVKLGIGISENSVGIGLHIFHEGCVEINGFAKIGKNLQLHGRNCIGNKGDSETVTIAPVIGDNVDFGVGASAYGGISIADDVRIGAGAVVVRSCMTSHVTLVGVPAKPLQ
ncbi:serine acetyltransferase [Bifidobacterium reuteri]|uniref:Serine acetyltransferase n=1 Tax=Bifidobacterium reuteri TaxID=983706 RepID=A0A5J5E6V0_9BIFI|nr:serine acetyltransferase [Bifidobacterium reuteri]KAA8824909.1 serine acetyltransferase [Bifidobacterium reuteri]